ncbi:MAG: hypothetical protein A3C84_00080 [Candidatus Ryanbacteria bacterium RIFCSPHIGHO2_02_FULL_48_12]|uniref:Nudix hydrolase domain-containing protein n=1 Tax=Candidatus Ryanbacteria bacterium RIFCSPHIGHO2_01_FULL_48_27 TaxID=1802115 RepID=A0A1G2G6H1_9BACT|nr:MAG: hypothetical protein A2756_00420 [Candidatus Ryanbacteria bacterium RIFCSPHIGHO2_01_FULL_48_27]OGZ50501.1 MAG: hypothetical protein A3C84_00080 [Candidatus Ryanbacteria bacterium RIFCSPHIGHO2_02_FULL_48_12]
MTEKLDGSIILREKFIHDARKFQIFESHYRTVKGDERTHCFLRYPPSVRIVPITRDGHIVLIREFKFAANEYVLCLPSGTVEQNETVLGAAKREMEEETAYTSDSLTDLGAYHLAPTLVEQEARVVLAANVHRLQNLIESDEYERDRISVVQMRTEEILVAVRDSLIRDGQAMVAILKAFVHLGIGFTLP